ncbi:uncharacterized protein sS8_2073 [Methylocaldum marinum]|uniref:Uncharacterized protein n=1 Tax=Methylocaldum marinum TaxID=1432792 RepID=A0A250KR55_9GAMM|nr:uncharacterized protein sS8_2073 [Methylocaldum marinum]
MGTLDGERHPYAGPDIRRSTHDLERLSGTVGNQANSQSIGLRVLRNLEDFGDDNAAERSSGGFRAIDLETRHRQLMDQFLRVYRRIDKFS